MSLWIIGAIVVVFIGIGAYLWWRHRHGWMEPTPWVEPAPAPSTQPDQSEAEVELLEEDRRLTGWFSLSRIFKLGLALAVFLVAIGMVALWISIEDLRISVGDLSARLSGVDYKVGQVRSEVNQVKKDLLTKASSASVNSLAGAVDTYKEIISNNIEETRKASANASLAVQTVSELKGDVERLALAVRPDSAMVANISAAVTSSQAALDAVARLDSTLGNRRLPQ